MAGEAAALRTLVAEELGRPVAAEIARMAAAIAGHHGGARAVLYYGSCLRTTQLHGLMLDFYLIVSDYRSAFGDRWLARANQLLPPNVFPFDHNGLKAKYAILSEADFARLISSRTRNVSVWARFSQPSRLVWSADEEAAKAAIDAVALAAPALLAAARPCLADQVDALELWRHAFALTYAAELRAESRSRSGSIVDADPERYRAFTLPALAAARLPAQLIGGEIRFERPLTNAARLHGKRAWARRRREGKLLTLLRLAKASTTYGGGLDYLAWKISRHSGHPVSIRPWQREWPILGAMTLLPRLLLKGAIR